MREVFSDDKIFRALHQPTVFDNVKYTKDWFKAKDIELDSVDKKLHIQKQREKALLKSLSKEVARKKGTLDDENDKADYNDNDDHRLNMDEIHGDDYHEAREDVMIMKEQKLVVLRASTVFHLPLTRYKR